ncbi:hypothetical protein [Flavobacterium sp.]|uniref:hypothetical protein n=1 Tax=Flavobacterium sp. TaxID=239 RepID=UPI00374DA0BF
MKGELVNEIINKIDTDKRFLLSVFDLQSGLYLYKYYPATKILEEFESGVNFFEHLYASGHKHLNLSSYRKNGTGKLNDGEPITVNFSEETETQPVAQPVQQTQPIPMMPQMNNDMFSGFGLNGVQVMDLFVQKNEAERLRTENSELKTKNIVLESENKRLQETELSNKYDWEKEKSKRDGNHGLIKDCIGSLPMIMAHLKEQNSGLNASQEVNYGSPTKNDFAEKLKMIDDNTLTILSSIHNASATNVNFANELVELLKKHGLWE